MSVANDKTMKSVRRRSRIVGIQKISMVHLVQNYFIRRVGHHCNVDFDDVQLRTWEAFAEILNNQGPPKSAINWRKCFVNMKSRIWDKVKLIKQVDANLVDNLSELDLQIHEMFPNAGFGDDIEILDDDDVGNSVDLNSIDVNEDVRNNNYEMDNEIVHSEVHVNYNTANKELKKDTNETNFDVVNFVHDATTTNSVHTREEAEAIVDAPVIIEDVLLEDLSQKTVRFVEKTSRSTGKKMVNQHTGSALLQNSSDTNIHIGDEVSRGIGNIRVQSTKKRPIKSKAKRSTKVSQKSVKNDALSEKLHCQEVKYKVKGSKIADIQKERLIQLIQNHFLKVVGRFSGANGMHIKDRLWETFAKELNELGPSRTAEQWKTTLDNIKSSVKQKLADGHNEDKVLAGKPLTRLEEKVVSIYGIDNLDGEQQLGEGGFTYMETVPVLQERNSKSNQTLIRSSGNFNLERSDNSRVCSSTITSSAYDASNSRNSHDQQKLIRESTSSYETEGNGNADIYNSSLSNELTSNNEFDELRHDLHESEERRSKSPSILREIWDEPDRNVIENQAFETSIERPSANSTANLKRQSVRNRTSHDENINSWALTRFDNIRREPAHTSRNIRRSSARERDSSTSTRTFHDENINSRSLNRFDNIRREPAHISRLWGLHIISYLWVICA